MQTGGDETIITVGENQKGFTVRKYDQEAETIFTVDGLNFNEVLEEIT